MKYKALISDVDGTLVPNYAGGRLSQRVIDTIAKAQEKIHIGIATARPYAVALPIVEKLKLSGPSIIHSGAQIIDFTTHKIYRQHEFIREDIKLVYEIVKKHKVGMYIDEEMTTLDASDSFEFDEPILGSYITSLTTEKADELIEEFSKIPTIAAQKIPSYDKGKIDISVSPSQATKQHGILEVAEILGIKTEEIIGIGDGYNDFPLLMACGLKIAIGNAVPELKQIADFIAPSVEEDGVAEVIEKFVLQ